MLTINSFKAERVARARSVIESSNTKARNAKYSFSDSEGPVCEGVEVSWEDARPNIVIKKIRMLSRSEFAAVDGERICERTNSGSVFV